MEQYHPAVIKIAGILGRGAGIYNPGIVGAKTDVRGIMPLFRFHERVV